MAKKTTSRKPIKVLKKKAVKPVSKKKQQEMESAPKSLFYPREHRLVAKHEILAQEEVEALFTQYKVSPQNLPIIFASDPGLAGLPAKMGDIVRITRNSPTAGSAVFFRRVAYE